MVKSFAAIVLASAVNAAASFRSYPLYTQCNSSWGNNPMGVKGNGERSTICGEGCAMSSLSMGLAGLGATIDGAGPTPGTLNAWLEANKGYECVDNDCNNLILNAVTRLNSTVTLIGENPTPPASVIEAGLLAGDTLFLAHVRNRSHFVLLTGFDPSIPNVFWVNDPYYAVSSYPIGNISDIIMYKVGGSALRGVPATNAVISANRFGPAGENSVLRLTGDQHGSGAHVEEMVGANLKSGSAIIPFDYPLYKQCDPRWGNHIMEVQTICAVGCLMSSTSMAIAGKHVSVAKSLSTPDTLNTFLRDNKGYTGGDDMDEAVVPEVNPAHISWPADGMHATNDIPVATIQAHLKAGRPVIANVMQGHHFVLVIGWDPKDEDTLLVNDPGFNTLSYSYSKDVVGWRLFQMTMCTSGC